MKDRTWIKPGIWGVAIGAVGAMVVGFNWGGWMTRGTAEQVASDRAETAVVAVYTPVCVANAQRAGADQIAQLKAAESWKRDDFVVEAGWVTHVGETYRDDVARACAPKVMQTLEASAEPVTAEATDKQSS